MKNIKPTANGEPQEVKIKVRINNNGVILVTSANLVDKKAIKVAEEPTPADNSSGSTENGNNMDTQEVSQCIRQNVNLPVFHFILLICFFASIDLNNDNNQSSTYSDLYKIYK